MTETFEKNYTALHNHSHYSTLDGYATIDEYIEAAKRNGMKGIGLCDHGTASGLYKFITRTQKAGLTPIPGIEFYVAPENPKGAKCKSSIYYGKGGRRAPKYDVSNGAYTHLTVFAYNNVGLRNLFILTSLSWKPENYYFKPRIDTNMLAEHSEGLIVTTGCPSSEVSRRFLLGQDDKAYEYANRLKSIFGDNLYVEIMNHKMKDDELENILVPKQIKLAKDLGIKLIATNDSHYAFKEDAEPHERVLAVSTKSTMFEKPRHEGGKRFSFSTQEYHIKTYDEMLGVYPKEVAEEALRNTNEIMEKCKDIKLEYDSHLRPEIEIPEGYTDVTYLQKLIYDGFVAKRGHESKEIQAESVKRIQEEFEVLHSNDFISYFLVVHDYIDFAHKKGIGVGAGRGSVGGSEIAYVLDISNTDPIRFNLLFERFLSPGRGSLYQIEYSSGKIEETPVSTKKRIYTDDKEKVVYVHELNPGDMIDYEGEKEVIENVFVKVPGSAPDVDTDFHTEGREEVVQYCVRKYGEENVANIITFGTFLAKKSFKAMATIYNIPYAQANKISKAIVAPIKDLLEPTSANYREGVDFRTAIENNEILEEAVEMAIPLDGRICETGVHPCGVIISNTPLAGVIPTQVRQDDGKIITQWEYPELEALGLIKMDLLGLELLNTVQQTLENIRLTNESESNPKNIREVPDMRRLIQGKMDDKGTYEMLREGNTIGIFQLGSPGVRELLVKAQPKEFMDIATITALYRPGPMSMNSHLEWAERNNGEKEVISIDERLKGTVVEEILAETSGVLVYQESLMQIATKYALMTPYESDSLRKAMGKKKMDIMLSMKPKFIEGAIKNGSTKELAEKIWETMEGFAAYGFNKSHSVSYAINIYQSLYLKRHYPNEFMSALIQQGFSDPVKAKEYIQEAKRMKIRIGPVDINNSQVKMASTGLSGNENYDIVFGFSGVKKMNTKLAQAIVDERNKNGKFESVANFVSRMSKVHPITAAPLQSLALAGAFDSFNVSRKLIVEKSQMLVQSVVKKVDKGTSLLSLMGSQTSTVEESIEINGDDYEYNRLIQKEADVLGIFVSGHPTSKLGHIAKMYKALSIKKVSEKPNRIITKVIGTITMMESKTNRSGNKSIAIMIDDGDSTASSFLPKELVKSIQKQEELDRIAKAKAENVELKETKNSIKLREIIEDDSIVPIEMPGLNEPYVFDVVARKWNDSVRVSVVGFEKLHTAPDGSLPYEIKVSKKNHLNDVKSIMNKHMSENEGVNIKINYPNGNSIITKEKVKLSLDFIMDMEMAIGKENIITKGI